MNSFDQLINYYQISEAISLRNAKKRKLSKKYSGAYNDRMNQIFGNKNRILSKINIDYSNLDSPLFKKIDAFLDSHEYTIYDMSSYIKGLAYKYKYDNNDNLVIDRKNPVKIGKLLQKYEPDGQIEVTNRVNGKKTTKEIVGKPLLHEFKNDPLRATNGEFIVVISRHPYDISGASTDRSWTSCMDLGLPRINYPNTKQNYGVNRKYIPNDIKEGTLVAYVVSKDELYKGANGEDKVKLQKPLSRILIKPHNSDVGKVYTIGQLYGSKYPEFYQTIKEWVSKNLNNKLTGDEKIYKNTALYNDSDVPVGFDFNTGNSIADEIMNEKLGYHNEKELGNQITFETSGQGLVDINMNIEFQFGQDIVRPFKELIDFKKHDISKIYSPIERALASVVFDELHIGQYSNIYPTIDMISLGEGIDVNINFSISVYTADDKFVDNDYIGDQLDHHLNGLKNFNYKNLKTKLYKICSQYDWSAEEQRYNAEINKYVSHYHLLMDKLPELVPDIELISKLNIVSPEKMISYGNEEMVRYAKEISKIRQVFVRIVSIKTHSFDTHIPYMISKEETYKTQVQQIIQQWFLKTLKIDLRKYSDRMSDMWRYKKIRDMQGKIPDEDYQNLLDIQHELFPIDSSIERLIGHNPNDVKI
jgi:hypothetical protein